MSNFSKWISAMRLRTLPLSISGIIVGSCLAAFDGFFNTPIFVLAIFTTLSLQILSNLANDYGDGIKGTDNDDRIGPMRALQSGAITALQMRSAIKLNIGITLVFAIALIWVAFGKENFAMSVFFFVLGVACVVAAIKYTVGNSAYGYKGLGDVFVFLFFGLVSVIGSYVLYVKQIDYITFLPAITIGLLSAGVLNLNNMRDILSDAKSNKNTLVVKMGSKTAKQYHYFLVGGALVLNTAFVIIFYTSPINLIVLVAYIPLIKHLITVHKNKVPKDLDPELKKLALSTFLLALLLGLGFVL
ncbi:1,4-dihydroxy-2-naphthoate octaprenyltransferase [Formosa sediminum]|uniref:1,4-dihydroxy-2-naphthoate octaprenyltransferase n=1 Tax=Formosa sediminum TaxID=2594004 RepID=A0A516GT88_9FLAO|nr:1,4-dihydroxy-2-naphthoate octaprenyltransferase [Formosa sediminum]QDO94729.1 1,4-dihydroxy-2-naphthoate octaprenyltransferase [Formosa sediminum]